MKKERNTGEDAILTRLMAEYAEQEGARLWREFEEAQSRGEVPQMPERTDRKCRRRIEAEFSWHKEESFRKPLLKFAERAAAAVIVGAWYDGGAASEEDPEELRSMLNEEWPEE